MTVRSLPEYEPAVTSALDSPRQPIKVVLPSAMPELTPKAARVLLTIICELYEAQRLDDGLPDTGCRRTISDHCQETPTGRRDA